MVRICILIAFAACQRPPAVRSQLVTKCESSANCRGDSNGCIYCFNGQCSCTLPADPLPVR